jgi:hypothetical protein
MVFYANLIFKEEPHGQINGRQEGRKKEAGQNGQGKEEGQAGKKEEIEAWPGKGKAPFRSLPAGEPGAGGRPLFITSSRFSLGHFQPAKISYLIP